MHKDMHYAGTYALAKLAGLSDAYRPSKSAALLNSWMIPAMPNEPPFGARIKPQIRKMAPPHIQMDAPPTKKITPSFPPARE